MDDERGLLFVTLAGPPGVHVTESTPSPKVAFAMLTDEILLDGFRLQPLNAVGSGLHQ